MRELTSDKSSNFPLFYVKDKQENCADHHDGTYLGFWIYLMSDCLIFAVFFVIYAVLGKNYAAGPAQIDIFDISSIFISTIALLLSSLSCSFATLVAKQSNKAVGWLLITAFFGIIFIIMEVHEFVHLISIGAVPQRSAFLSSFFALVGLHGLHVFFGLVWLFVLVVQILNKGLFPDNRRRLMCFSMFWHFLDLIWICVFSFVYLMGVV
ncbi:cytochrome o ubiquinol oxidase subunit III [Candidatus Liberibacter africanus]|uniref:Cytochrome bo(3) ubiquinol oxidase subunit 3 n=1 Tax=Candidatus Liberibacter africanus PTSAPSY TaxID=1277257 RepID=A0A0G3I8U5_LIBAF|nr:cytochrome o ubiquinol oxidase subunit III [Candidatus Liberibacter africanus]AKK20182.1 cytochrome o ubiquinol oxidase subunit III [Candidatus Liberibacter africanus PTSAPSY]